MRYPEVSKKVRECKNRYLLYFAYGTVKKKEGGYKEENSYTRVTYYDITTSDSLEEIRKCRDALIEILDPINSYVSIIVDKEEQKFLHEANKYVSIEDVYDYYKIGEDNKKERNLIMYGCKITQNKKLKPDLHFEDKLEKMDFFFRGPDEVPKDYKWDEGEYKGWLQFRWGDGKNAIPK